MQIARVLLATAVASIAGCANTPTQLMAESPTRLFRSPLSPIDAADCMARNAEEKAAAFSATTRPSPGGGREVIVRVADTDFIYATARLTPNGAGSVGELWSGTFAGSVGTSPEDNAAMLLRGCGN